LQSRHAFYSNGAKGSMVRLNYLRLNRCTKNETEKRTSDFLVLSRDFRSDDKGYGVKVHERRVVTESRRKIKSPWSMRHRTTRGVSVGRKAKLDES